MARQRDPGINRVVELTAAGSDMAYELFLISDGDLNDRKAKVDANGALRISPVDSGGNAISSTGEGDGGSTFTTALAVVNHQYDYDEEGAVYRRKRLVMTHKSAQANGVASGSDLTVWTPGASKKFRLRGIVVAASGSGRFELRDGTGTVIAYLRLSGNAPLVVPIAENGYQSTTANNALLVRNQTGGASDIDAWAWGSEA